MFRSFLLTLACGYCPSLVETFSMYCPIKSSGFRSSAVGKLGEGACEGNRGQRCHQIVSRFMREIRTSFVEFTRPCVTFAHGSRSCHQSLGGEHRNFLRESGNADYFSAEYRKKLFLYLTPLRIFDNHHGLPRQRRNQSCEGGEPVLRRRARRFDS